ncbi:MAG: deoxyribose-phosphate aldolase [Terriglobales bacterium]
MIELARHDYDALVEQILQAARSRPEPAVAVGGLAGAIESTLLAPGATAVEVERLCEEAAALGVAAVCVAPVWTALAVARLRPTPVLVSTVVGFPLGASLGTVKAFEAAECLKLGADELDVVINLGALKSGHHAQVEDELYAITALAHAAAARIKVILEMDLLSPGELEQAVAAALAAGVDFLKNGTGFGPGGATVEGIARLRVLAAGRARLKAAGGIRTAAQARALLAAGADRIGTSAAAAVLS